MNPSSLKHFTEFTKILSSYHASERALKAIEGLKLVLMLAPTSSGRNTIIRHLLTTGNYYYIVSDTTRQPRVNDGVIEQNGREYWFKSEEEVLEDLKAGEYLEAEIIHNQQISGISIRELEKAQSESKIAITDIDLEGVHNVMKVKKDAIPILLLPPSYDEWQKRILQRGRMSMDEQHRRLKTAMGIFEDGLSQPFYRFVISDTIEHAASTINAIASGKPNPQQGRGAEVLHELRSRLEHRLSLPG